MTAVNQREAYLSFYRDIYRIRSLEQHVLDLSREKDPIIRGSIHLCAGQEAVPVGAMAALREIGRAHV